MDPNSAANFEEEVSEQPVDYSKKYTERDIRLDSRCPEVSEQENKVRVSGTRKKEFPERESKIDLFGDYAETDLDQPTDYSLRYAEDDTDEEDKQDSHEYFPGGVQEDTVKTYCTEGTPYETPFNFSTATSMSDLRLEDSKESSVDPAKKPAKKVFEVSQKDVIDIGFKRTPVSQNPVPNVSNPLRHKEVSSMHIGKATTAPKESRNLIDPDSVDEKLSRYYDSSTPDAFPRVNSLSSIGSSNTQQNTSDTSSKASSEDVVKAVPSNEISNNVSQSDLNPGTLETPAETDGAAEAKTSARVIDKEGKMVTFGGEDFYPEQTPLMFSRCSSLDSLSGFEQLSIHDDRSSIVSDFSRRTSGIVSPSELPDSPTQTVPPSPHNRKSQCADFKISEEAVRPSVRHLSYPKAPVQRSSVFEDDIATFKEESTPIEFSNATSLSSLTIDDEMKLPEPCMIQQPAENIPVSSVKEVSLTEDSELPKEREFAEKACQVEVEKEQEQVSDADEGDEDDEDMLAACISMGMQNNRYRQSFKPNNTQKPSVQVETPRVLVRYPRNAPINKLEPRVSVTPTENSTNTKRTKPPVEATAAPDTVHVYCTEDTPADISPVGSQSNLSALSMPSLQEDVEGIKEEKVPSETECQRNDLSDESSNLSGEDEKILDECIQSGIPKVRQITPPPTNCIPFTQKPEMLSQRFNICGTPSSSPVEGGNKNPPLAKPICRPIENEHDFSDDSLNHSDDEAILTECIRSAMPKARLNISPLTGLSSSQNTQKCKASTSQTRKPPVPYFQPRYVEKSKEPPKRPVVLFENNICLSEEEEEEDRMLAQCIRSGIPRALNVSSASQLTAPTKKVEASLKPRTVETLKPRPSSNRDVGTQVQTTSTQKLGHAEQDVGNNFLRFHPKPTERSRHTPRTVPRQGKSVAPERQNPSQNEAGCSSKYSIPQTEQSESVRDLSNGSASQSHVGTCASPMANGTENYEDEDSSRNILKSSIVPSRHSSVSSLSEEGSLGSIEEWALLELCINSGMPRSRCRLKGTKMNENCSGQEDREAVVEDNYSICSYSSYVCKT